MVVFLKIVQAKRVEHKPSEIMEKYLQRQGVLKRHILGWHICWPGLAGTAAIWGRLQVCQTVF